MAVRNLLFDFDGTIADGSDGIVAAMRFALGKHAPGIAVSDERIRVSIGPPLKPMIKKVLEGTPAGDNLVDPLAISYREYYTDQGLFQARLYPGIKGVLEALSREFSCFIVSSKPREFVERLLEKFGIREIFAAVYGPGLDLEPKKKAEFIAELLADRNLNAAECVMIGDKAEDVMAAKSNRIKAIGVGYGFGTREELLAAGAKRVAASPEDLTAEVIEVVGGEVTTDFKKTRRPF